MSADNAVALELALWDSVKDGSPAELESDLEQYPEGTFASLAQTQLEAAALSPMPARRHQSKSPPTLSTLPSGIPSRTATGARSLRPTSSNIPMGILPDSPARALLPLKVFSLPVSSRGHAAYLKLAIHRWLPSAGRFAFIPQRAVGMQAADYPGRESRARRQPKFSLARSGGGLAHKFYDPTYHPDGWYRDGLTNAS